MNRWISFDERTDKITGKIAFIFLGITQAGLVLAIIYQRYILELAPAYYNDLALILGMSVIGFWLTNFLLGGYLPILSPKNYFITYIIIVLLIAIPHMLIRGFPAESEWGIFLLVVLGAPAVILIFYSAAAFLGKRRIEKILEKEKHE